MPNRFTFRAYQRFPVQCRVHYRGPDGPGQGTARNLSRIGWRVTGNRPVAPGDHLTLVVYLPNKRRLALVDRAVVRWSRGEEFGLENVTMTRYENLRLEVFVTSFVRTRYGGRP